MRHRGRHAGYTIRPGAEQWRIGQTEAELCALAGHLDELRLPLAVCEATAGLEIPLAPALRRPEWLPLGEPRYP